VRTAWAVKPVHREKRMTVSLEEVLAKARASRRGNTSSTSVIPHD